MEALTARVMTLSDRAAAGEMRDESGPALRDRLREAGFGVQSVEVLADDAAQIQARLGVATQEVNLVVPLGAPASPLATSPHRPCCRCSTTRSPGWAS